MGQLKNIFMIVIICYIILMKMTIIIILEILLKYLDEKINFKQKFLIRLKKKI